MIIDTTEIMTWKPLTAIVEAYTDACGEVRQAFDLLDKAKHRLINVLGDRGRLFETNRVSDFDLPAEATASCHFIKKTVWYYLLEKTEILNLISGKQKNQLLEQIRVGNVPDITVDNITSILENLRTSIPDLLNETIREAFEFLRPLGSQYKTNSEFEVGRKVILDYALNVERYGIYLHMNTETKLRSIDNAFHLMDGKGPVKYPNDLTTRAKEAMRYRKWECETPYFRLKWFKKGTIHLEILRDDLLAEFNRIGGGNRLRPGKSGETQTADYNQGDALCTQQI